MTKMEVPFFRPFIGEEEISEVEDCLRNGWLTTGAKARRFEADFADFVGGDAEAIAVNSATAGLHLALEASGIGPGDEVIVPDYTFTATAEVVRYLGAHPVFVDIQYETLNIDPSCIEAAITSRTRAIMPVHFAGLACDMIAIEAIAEKHGLKIIEDAAHALPCSSAGRSIGSFASPAAVFSFYANKTITTGEGGMILTSDPKMADRMRKMRLHGFDRNAFDRFKTGNWNYDVVAPGYKYNLTDIAAALGLHQLKRAEFFRQERTRISERYFEGLADLPLDLPARAVDGDVHSWHLFIVRTNADCRLTRDELFEALRQSGITCSVHYTPLHRFSYWRDTYDLKGQDFPNAERAGQNAISLPVFVGMKDAQINYVIETLRELIS